MMFCTLISSPSHAQISVEAQLRESADHAMTELIRDYAQAHNLQGLEHRVEHQIPAALPNSPCSQPLQVERQNLEAEPWKRQRLSLSCPSSNWTISLTSQAQVLAPMVVTHNTLERNQHIQTEDLRLELKDISKARRGFFNQLNQVSGQSAKRRLREGQVIHPGLLETALLVRRGETVTIIAKHNGIHASTQGQALADGRRGEVIRVLNTASEKIIETTVLEMGTVQSQTP